MVPDIVSDCIFTYRIWVKVYLVGIYHSEMIKSLFYHFEMIVSLELCVDSYGNCRNKKYQDDLDVIHEIVLHDSKVSKMLHLRVSLSFMPGMWFNCNLCGHETSTQLGLKRHQETKHDWMCPPDPYKV